MGNTEQEQAEAMKRYIREVFIPEYAKNFNKELTASDIKFYGKIHFNRNRSNNKLNMHCHLIASRKDQSNKKKLSPLTNHKNTKSGIIKGGFDRVNLFQQVEQGFDKLLGYNRQQKESFDYHNTIRNSAISEQKNCKSKNFNSMKEKLLSIKIAIKKTRFLSIMATRRLTAYLSIQTEKVTSKLPPSTQQSAKQYFCLFAPFYHVSSRLLSNSNISKEQIPNKPKKKEGRTQAII